MGSHGLNLQLLVGLGKAFLVFFTGKEDIGEPELRCNMFRCVFLKDYLGHYVGNKLK